MSRIQVKFKPSDKQKQFLAFFGIMMAAEGIRFEKPTHRYVLYGGAIRGGKTIALFLLFTLLGLKYPGSRWTIVRKDLATLKKNTIPSWEEKFARYYDPEGHLFEPINRDEWSVTIKPTGSKIIFMGENIDKDPDLERFNGHESNGYGLEEANELNKKTRDKCILRAGSWVMDPMPPAIVPMTCNPAQGWVKTDYYDRHVKGELSEPYAYIFANIFDNPFLPQEFIDNIEASKDNNPYFYARYVYGDWEAREGDYFKNDQFKIVRRHDHELFTIGLFCDIAYTAKKGSDECAFGVAGCNAAGQKHMFWSFGKAMTEDESIGFIIRKMIELKEQQGPRVACYVEAHSSYLFALRQEMAVENVDFLIVELKHKGVAKWDRILNVRSALYRWSWDPTCQRVVNQFLDATPDNLDLMLVDLADMAAYADREIAYDPNQVSPWSGRPDPEQDPVGADIWDKKHGRDNDVEVTSI